MIWRRRASGNLSPGATFEKYTVEKFLGRGGMGAVYLVRHNVLDSPFALKVLFPEVATRDALFVNRFIREAKLACKIKHPNLIEVHDAGKNSKNGMYYLIMDYVSGGSVREMLNSQRKIAPERAISIIAQVASALGEAHKHKMVHRDIKPDNIMFTEDGVCKLADLGIAKSAAEQDVTLTTDNAVFGTPAYMSPEQAIASGKVDCRADIYSLGIVLFEMLTGKRPYCGKSSMEILSQVVRNDNIPDVREFCPGISADVAELVRDMTLKNIDERIADPDELTARILKIQDFGTNSEEASLTEKILRKIPGKTLSKIKLSPIIGAKNFPSPVASEHWDKTVVVGDDAGQKEQGAIRSAQKNSAEKKNIGLMVTGIVAAAIMVSLAIFFIIAAGRGDSTESADAGNSVAAPVVLSGNVPVVAESGKETETTGATAGEDKLVPGAVVVIGNEARNFKSAIEKSGKAPVVFRTTGGRSDSLRQLKEIIKSKPRCVILIPAAKYAKQDMSLNNFENLILNEALLLRDNLIPFAFMLSENDPDEPKVELFNDAIRKLCNSRSITVIETQDKLLEAFREILPE